MDRSSRDGPAGPANGERSEPRRGPSGMSHRRRRVLKWLLACVLVLLVGASALLGFLPALLSSSVGSRVLLSWLSARIPGSVEVRSLELRWSTGQTVEGLSLFDEQGRSLFAVDSVEAPTVSLWSILRGGRELGPIRIVRPSGRLDALVRLRRRPRRTQDVVPRRQAPSPRVPPAPRRRPPRLDNLHLALQVEDADLLLDGGGDGGDGEVRLRIPRFSLDLTDPTRVALSCRADLVAGDRHGGLDVDLLLSDMFDDRGTVRPDKVRVEGTVVACDVHVALLDELAGLDGLLAAQIGPRVSGRLQMHGALHRLAGLARIESDRLNIEARWRRSGAVVHFDPDTTLLWQFDGHAWERLAGRLGLPVPPKLLEPVEVEFRPAKLSIPMSRRGFRWPLTAIEGQVLVGDVKLDGGGRVGLFRLARGTLDVQSSRAGQLLDVQMSCVAERDGRRARLTAQAIVANLADLRGAARVKLDGSLSDLPVALLDMLGRSAAAVATEAVGPLVDVNFSSSWQAAAAGRAASANFDVALKARHLDARVVGIVDAPERQVRAAGEVNVTVHPETWAHINAWYGEDLPARFRTMAPAAPIQVNAKVQDVVVSLESPGFSRWAGSVRFSVPAVALKGFDPLSLAVTRGATLSIRRTDGDGFDAVLEAPSVSFQISGGAEVPAMDLQDIKLHVSGRHAPGPLNINLTGAVLADGDDPTRARMPFDATCVLAGCFDSRGQFSLAGSHVEMSARFSAVPVELIDTLAGLKGRLTASIGATAAFEVEGQIPGHARLLVGNDIVQLPLNVLIHDREGGFHVELAEDVKASLMLTKRSSRALFGSVHPIFNDAVESTAPMRLLVRKQPFRLPLGPGEISGHPERIALDAILRIGTLKMDRRGWLTEGLDELTLTASKAVAHVHPEGDAEVARTYLAQFTPIHVTIADGKLSTAEFWVISEDLAIGFQGGSDLVRGDYRIFMGLLGASLIHQEPHLIHFVDPTNVYDIPIEGSVGSDPRIIKDEFALALTGSTAKRLVGIFGNQAQKLFEDYIARPIQQEQRRNLGGLDWHLPPPARDFIVRVLRTGASTGSSGENP